MSDTPRTTEELAQALDVLASEMLSGTSYFTQGSAVLKSAMAEIKLVREAAARLREQEQLIKNSRRRMSFVKAVGLREASWRLQQDRAEQAESALSALRQELKEAAIRFEQSVAREIRYEDERDELRRQRDYLREKLSALEAQVGFLQNVNLTLSERVRELSALEAEPPPLWRHAVNECNAAHAELDRLGAPKTETIYAAHEGRKIEVSAGLVKRIVKRFQALEAEHQRLKEVVALVIRKIPATELDSWGVLDALSLPVHAPEPRDTNSLEGAPQHPPG